MKKRTENAKYDGKNIHELEQLVTSNSEASRDCMRAMYEVLAYLEDSKRYKENPAYKKATFAEYLEDRFTIRLQTYRDNKDAFIRFPEQTIKLGVGIVAKTRRECGAIGQKKALQEIEKKSASRKTPLKRNEIENIIKQFSKNPDGNKIQKTITDWRAMYEAEKIAHNGTREYLELTLKENERLEEQIKKLKKHIKTIKPASRNQWGWNQKPVHV